MSSTLPTRWNPDLIEELVAHGFNRDALVADDADTFTQHDNQRFRYISATPVKAAGYLPRTDNRNGTRIKLYVREIKYPYAHIPRRVAPLVILTTNPRWKKSLARWMITTTMLLTEEVWQKEDIEKAKEQRKEDQRNNKLSSLLDEFEITPAQFTAHFRTNWDWQETDESPIHVASVLPFSVNPKRHNWDGDTQVKKIGRLMLFLHQEKWINLDEIKGRDDL